jgi:hypothetical protein
LTGVTMRRKSLSAVSAPSLTVRVIVVVPKASAAGVIVTVRPAPLPPKTMLLTGTSAVFELVALTVRSATAVSASPTVKASGPATVSSAIVWFVIALIVGAVFWPTPAMAKV